MQTSHEKLQDYWTKTDIIIKPFLKRRYSYSYDMAPEIEGNYLVLCNHNSNFDPWLCGLSFKRQMYFLAGENIFRMGLASWIVKKFWAPISKIKGKSDATAMIRLIRHLKEGHNVSLFPEGNRTFNGITQEMLPAIGKLSKTSGAALVTFKITGMYFTTPRWGRNIRRGKTQGSVVNVYTKEMLKAMSVEEVHNHILEDLYENAYETQQKEPIAYKGRRRAECIESVLYMCPKCGEIGSIVSKKHLFHCTKCKTQAEYTEYGYIEGDFGYKTIPDWESWQLKELYKKIDIAIAENSKEPILKDSYVELAFINEEHEEKIVDKGSFAMYTDKIGIGNTEFDLKDLSVFEVLFRRTLLFTTKNNENYQVFSKQFTCALNYMLAYKYIITKQV